MMQSLQKFIPAGLAHRLAPAAVSFFSSTQPLPRRLWSSFEFAGVKFENPLGVAAGVDKNGTQIACWENLGAGFHEVGTVTPYAQKGNPGKVLDRNWDQRTLWNRLGFPSVGSDDVYFNLLHSKENRQIPIFLNIGKNRKTTNEDAHFDYTYLADRFKDVADVLVMNISSPNTEGLRDLQNQLDTLLGKVLERAGATPVLVKLSPDMPEETFFSCIDTAESTGAAGLILTNTTLQRPEGSFYPTEGGVSGEFLKSLSRQALKKCLSHLGERKNRMLVVSVGGVTDPAEALKRLEMGADLVQTYSGLVFHGLRFFEDTHQLYANQKLEQKESL